MFTVMHSDVGTDTFYEAYRVERNGPHSMNPGVGVWIWESPEQLEGGCGRLITNGTVFVMNETGATVGKYVMPPLNSEKAQKGEWPPSAIANERQVHQVAAGEATVGYIAG